MVRSRFRFQLRLEPFGDGGGDGFVRRGGAVRFRRRFGPLTVRPANDGFAHEPITAAGAVVAAMVAAQQVGEDAGYVPTEHFEYEFQREGWGFFVSFFFFFVDVIVVFDVKWLKTGNFSFVW